MDESGLIAMLNSLSMGELDILTARLTEAEEACVSLGHQELADRLSDGRVALLACDTRGFRKQVETVISKLGHLR